MNSRKPRKVLWVFTRPPQYSGGEQWQNVTWIRWIRSGLRVAGMMKRYAYGYQVPYRSAPVTDSIDALSPPKPRGKICKPPMVRLVDPTLLDAPDADTLYLSPRELFDAALLGYTRSPQDDWPRTTDAAVAVYCAECVQRAVGTLLGDVDIYEIQEYIDFNVVGAWMGHGTPEIRRTDWCTRCS